MKNQNLINTEYILNTDYFSNDNEKYKTFIKNNAEYQKTLEYCKHVEKWK